MSIVLKKRYKQGTMSCSPMVDGIRSKVTCKCNEKCVFWDKCLKEIGCARLSYHFIERPSTEEEIKNGWFHLYGVKFKKLTWELIKKI